MFLHLPSTLLAYRLFVYHVSWRDNFYLKNKGLIWTKINSQNER